MLALASFKKQSDDVVVEFLLRSASPVAVLASRDDRRHERRKPQVDAGPHERRKPHVAACLGGFGSWGSWVRVFLKNKRSIREGGGRTA